MLLFFMCNVVVVATTKLHSNNKNNKMTDFFIIEQKMYVTTKLHSNNNNNNITICKELQFSSDI